MLAKAPEKTSFDTHFIEKVTYIVKNYILKEPNTSNTSSHLLKLIFTSLVDDFVVFKLTRLQGKTTTILMQNFFFIHTRIYRICVMPLFIAVCLVYVCT